MRTGECIRTYVDIAEYYNPENAHRIFRRILRCLEDNHICRMRHFHFFENFRKPEELHEILTSFPLILSITGSYFKSLEELCGLVLNENVDTKINNELRFHYLFSECSPPGFTPQDDEPDKGYHKNWDDYFKEFRGNRNRPFNTEELEKEEKEIDDLRDDLNGKIKDIEDSIDKDKERPDEVKEKLKDWLKELKDRSGEESDLSFPDIPLPERAIKPVKDIKKILHGKDNEGGLIQKEKKKKKDSDEIYRPLEEKGLKYRRLIIEGVLGDYSFNGRLITLYPKMIELVLPGLLSDVKVESEYKGFVLLNTVVKIHESVHAIWHSGEDKNKEMWNYPSDYSSELHETIAQYYTIKMIDELPWNEKIKDMFYALNKKQTFPYRLFEKLESIKPEKVRSFFIDMRKKDYSKLTYNELWVHILKTIASLYDFYLENLPSFSMTIIQKQVEALLKGEVTLETGIKFIEELRSIKPVKEMIELSIKRDLPERDELIFLYLEQIYRNGQKNGDSSRFTFEASVKGAELPKPEIPQELLNHPVITRLWKEILEKKEQNDKKDYK